MESYMLGKNIRKYRCEKSMSQEALAEKINLSTNYIGMLERGEKLPSLPTLIKIANTLDVTTDTLLCESLNAACEIKSTILFDKISALPLLEQKRIFSVIDTLLEYAKKISPL